MSARTMTLALSPYGSGLRAEPIAAAVLAGLGLWLARRRQQRRAHAAMAYLDQHLSRDIGLSREQA
jgi:uncharacterized protein YjiS (DUF1127 family)